MFRYKSSHYLGKRFEVACLRQWCSGGVGSNVTYEHEVKDIASVSESIN